MELTTRLAQFEIEIRFARLESPGEVIELVQAVNIKKEICLAWLFSEISSEERQRLIDFVDKSSVRSLVPAEF